MYPAILSLTYSTYQDRTGTGCEQPPRVIHQDTAARLAENMLVQKEHTDKVQFPKARWHKTTFVYIPMVCRYAYPATYTRMLGTLSAGRLTVGMDYYSICSRLLHPVSMSRPIKAAPIGGVISLPVLQYTLTRMGLRSLSAVRTVTSVEKRLQRGFLGESWDAWFEESFVAAVSSLKKRIWSRWTEWRSMDLGMLGRRLRW
jgi:hypothetical protein